MAPATPPPTPRRGAEPPAIIRHGFLAVLLLWLIVPIGLRGRVAQDAIPYLAAGSLATHQPHDVYASRHGDLFDLRPRFRRQWCQIAPADTDCDNLAVAFVSTPPVIPLAVALSIPSSALGAFLLQLGAALMLSGGMWLLWKRLAHRSRHAGELMLGTALLLTPMAMVPIGLGQTSPIMFLSVCLGLGSTTATRRVGAAIAWTFAALIKLFPGALVALLIARRRWKALGVAGTLTVVLSATSLLIVPLSTWGDFLRTTFALSGNTATNPYNGSFGSLLVRLLPGSQSHGVGAAAVTVLCVAAGAAICWFGMRGVDDDTRWAIGYLALLFVTPLVWWHYVWVAIGALAIVLAQQRKLDDRTLAILPLVAMVSVIPSIPNSRGWSMPVPQGLFLVAITMVILALVARQRRQRQQRPATEASATPA